MFLTTFEQQGLIEAVKELLPYAEHRLCARHIYANFKKKWNGLHYKSLFWGAAASILVVHFKHKMKLIKNIDPLAYNWLMERDPKAWCRAYFQMDRSCAAFENGISESYHSAIGFARSKPIITMIEEIRIYLMQRIVAMNQKAVNLNDIVCPAIRKELEKLKKYQRWDLSSIPCIHAVAAYSLLNQDPSKGVSSWYSKQMWVDAYSHFIKPVGGSSIWVKSANPPPLPPKKRIMPGRLRKNRIKHVTKRVNQVSRAEKRKPGRKRKQAANQQFNPPNADPTFEDSSLADPSAADSSFVDPSSADRSAADSSFVDPSSADPSAANSNIIMGADITDAEIAALADMNEAEEREARRKDAERVLEEAKRKGVYRKRGAGGWRGPSERIANQKRKKEDPNGPGKNLTQHLMFQTEKSSFKQCLL
ncbi:hypothetical protein Tco_1224993 [Tanacetum coccineum]